MTRAARSFWILVGIAAVAMGALSKAAVGAPGPGTGVAVALSASLAVGAVALAARILLRTERSPGKPEPVTSRRRCERL